MVTDVVIVGAGIVGAACAWECARAGLNTVVIDRGPVSGGATAAGMGQIVVTDGSEAEFALTRYSQQLWQELAGDLPASAEVDRCGTIWIAANDEEMQEVHRKRQFYEERGMQVDVLDAVSLETLEPNLRKGFAGGLQMPGDFVIYAPCATDWLMQQAQQLGTQLRLGETVQKMTGGGVRTQAGEYLSAGIVINAAGSWARALMPSLPVLPRKGHLVITDRYPGFVRHQLVELGYLKSAHSVTTDSVAFNVQPRKTGQLLIGSSREYDNDSPEIDSKTLQQMIDRAVKYLPGLARMSAIRVWTGFRAATPDSLPLIGPVPGENGVYLATGHEGLGITTSLGTARLLVDQILGRDTAIPPEPYLPSRFEKVQCPNE